MNNLQRVNIQITIISDITLEPEFSKLLKTNFSKDIKIDYIPYTEYKASQYNILIKKSDIIVVWLNFETILNSIIDEFDVEISKDEETIENICSVCGELYNRLLKYNKTIIWILFEDYFSKNHFVLGNNYNIIVDQINIELWKKFKEDIVFVNLKQLISAVGILNTYDISNKYRWNSPYSKQLIKSVAKEIYKEYLIIEGKTKKCLILDCDNVLWGGVLADDGIEKIKLDSSGLGRVYKDFQRYVLTLYHHGVILAICSKNDISDVMVMFRKHTDMVLKEDHISCFQVNWENKPHNIKRISDTLNIALESMVFVDDSPMEIEAVKFMLPEVTSILFNHDSIYEQLKCFNLKSNIKITDIEKRNVTYRTNLYRKALKAEYKNNYEEYLEALNIRADIHKVQPIEYSRISELTQRTNRCTNGKRYTIAEIRERIGMKNVTMYSLTVSDRFSDIGLVGVLEIEENKLTLFSLSCRALGRDLEKRMLEYISSKHCIANIEFGDTGKNKEMKNLLATFFPNAIFV